MQYALFDGQKRKFLLDATEFGVLKDWKDNPVRELLDFNESLFNIYNVVGFTPDEELKLIEQYALYGIAYLRDINVYNAPCSRASAIYALSNYTEIKEKFTKFFDIKL